MTEPLSIVATRRRHALEEVNDEMERQIDKWGVQEHPSYKHKDLIGYLDDMADDMPSRNELTITQAAKDLCDSRLGAGECSWQDILNEEFLEARDEAIAGNTEALREELIQIAAVALSWVGSIDRETHRCPQCGLTEGAHKMSCTLRLEVLG
jgi:hypothetical protein